MNVAYYFTLETDLEDTLVALACDPTGTLVEGVPEIPVRDQAHLNELLTTCDHRFFCDDSLYIPEDYTENREVLTMVWYLMSGDPDHLEDYLKGTRH